MLKNKAIPLGKIDDGSDNLDMISKCHCVLCRKTFVELCFLIDCTWNMDPWLKQLEQTLPQVIKNTIQECFMDTGLRFKVSIVGYRDIEHQIRFEVQPFSENVEEVANFVGKLKPQVGNDKPEDMQGGLKICLLQDWTEEAIK